MAIKKPTHDIFLNKNKESLNNTGKLYDHFTNGENLLIVPENPTFQKTF